MAGLTPLGRVWLALQCMLHGQVVLVPELPFCLGGIAVACSLQRLAFTHVGFPSSH